MSGVLTSTQLCPMASFGSLPVWVKVSSIEVQSAATTSSCLSYCIMSLPEMASLHTLSAALAAVGNTTAAPISAADASTCRIKRIIFSPGKPNEVGGNSIRHAEPLMHDRARGRVLQELLLLRKQVMLNGERGERGLVKAGQDQLFLARIGVDIADGEHSRQTGLKLLRVDLQRLFLQLQA